MSSSSATVTDLVAGEFGLHVYTKPTRQGCTALPCTFGLGAVDVHVHDVSEEGKYEESMVLEGRHNRGFRRNVRHGWIYHR